MRPALHARTDLAGLQDQRVEAALEQVGGGGQADRAGNHHRHRQACRVTVAVTATSEIVVVESEGKVGHRGLPSVVGFRAWWRSAWWQTLDR